MSEVVDGITDEDWEYLKIQLNVVDHVRRLDPKTAAAIVTFDFSDIGHTVVWFDPQDIKWFVNDEVMILMWGRYLDQWKTLRSEAIVRGAEWCRSR
jgi:hypothetical protein